ncbi:hypothetical protein [Marimonas arenosa]|uniref:Uncharacterized protein n=1 Tax=Marimonas arenosa TaxID=1795305 RepID=A0AAE3WFB9_9RHOB|nr:hypothetical protein [Marimonas arenosa]MDQ2091589.1 hypothetical protein [Marimonas arenosa]
MFLSKLEVSALAAAVLSAGALAAAELAPRYEAMGEMTVEMGGDILELVIPYDKEKGSAYAEQKMIMGSFLTINSVGRVVGADGAPGRPMVQVTLQRQSGSFKLLSAELFDQQGFDAPMAMGADGGKGAIAEISYDNDRLEAVVEGTFLRLTGYSKGTPAPAEGAEPQPVVIRWQVDLPPLK